MEKSEIQFKQFKNTVLKKPKPVATPCKLESILCFLEGQIEFQGGHRVNFHNNSVLNRTRWNQAGNEREKGINPLTTNRLSLFNVSFASDFFHPIKALYHPY